MAARNAPWAWACAWERTAVGRREPSHMHAHAWVARAGARVRAEGADSWPLACWLLEPRAGRARAQGDGHERGWAP